MKTVLHKKSSQSSPVRSKKPFFMKSGDMDSPSKNLRLVSNRPFFNHSGFDFSPGTIQPKLTIGQPGDKYEREADAVADQVMRMPDSQLQRQTSESDEEEMPMLKAQSPLMQMKCTECEKEEESLHRKPLAGNITPFFQRQEANGGEVNDRTVTSLKSGKSGGQPLSDDTRSWMESRFGTDFSHVRVHTDANAIQMSRDLNAQAFTYGSDVYFNRGRFNPKSSEGKHLLAHELTHVLQQRHDSGIQNSNIGNLSCPYVIQRTIGDGHDLRAEPIALNPVLEAAFDNEQLIRRGQEGEAIRKIQESLILLGFILPKFGADGIFGFETESVLRQYQVSRGLSADGIVGPLTLGRMDSDLGTPGEEQSKIADIDVPGEIETGEIVYATARTTTGDEVSAPVTWRLLQGPPGAKIQETSAPETTVTSPNSGFLTLSASKSPQKTKTVKVSSTETKVCKYTFKELNDSKASGGQTSGFEKSKTPMVLWFDFISGKSDIRPNHKAAVKKLIQIDDLDQKVPKAKIRFIFGFSDCIGQETNNLGIRMDRALALRSEFISSGARPKHLGMAAPSRPGAEIGNNFTPGGRARNRSALVVSEYVDPPKKKKKRKKLDDIIDRLKEVAKTIKIKNQRKRLLCLLDIIMDKSKDDHYINGFDHLVRILAKGQFPRLSKKDFAKFVLNMSTRKDLTNPSIKLDDDKMVRDNLKQLDKRILSGINLVFDQLNRNGQLNFENPVLEQMHEFISIQQRNPDSIYFCYGKGQK